MKRKKMKKTPVKKLRFNKKSFFRSKKVLLLFVVFFAGIGVFTLLRSSAYVPKLRLNDGEFTELSPARVHDGSIGENQTISIPINGLGGVPGTQVRAVMVNLTVAGPTKSGYMTAFASGQAMPDASSINFTPSSGAIANLITVPVGADGRINLYNAYGAARVIVDVSGYFAAEYGTSGSRFNPINPYRARDVQVTENSYTQVNVAGLGGVPSSGVSAVVVNLTAASPTKNGYFTAFPSGGQLPGTSSLNFVARTGAIANQITVKLGADGKFMVYNPYGGVRLIADVSGYYSADGSRFVGLNPTRIHDSGFGENQTKSINVVGTNGIPPSHVKAVLVNVTVSGPTKAGYATVYPSGTSLPDVSTLNFAPATGAIANQIVAKVGDDGKINVLNRWGGARIILDVSGYYINNDQLEITAYDSSKVMPTTRNTSINLIHNDVRYGPSASHTFDIYETANQPSAAASNRDTLVWFFGGGWEGGNNGLTTGHDIIAKHLAAQYGFKLVAANYRLSGEAPYPAQYQDAVAVIKHLKANAAALDIDPNRIIISGFSAGADLAVMAGLGYNAPEFQPNYVSAAVAQQSALVNRIFALAPPVDKVAWASNYSANANPIPGLNKLVGLPGNPSPQFDRYAWLGALQYASADDPPMYAVMSPIDDVIPFNTQLPAFQQIGARSSTVLQRGNQNGHVAGMDTNVSALLEYLR